MFLRFKFTFLCFSLLFWMAVSAAATEMVYAPVNPSFGGNPNNAPGLMSIAQAQNGFTAAALSPIASFNLNLQRAILSRLTSQTLTSIFGNSTSNPLNTLQDNTYDTVGYTVNVLNNTADRTVTITTTDKITGAVVSFSVGTSLQ